MTEALTLAKGNDIAQVEAQFRQKLHSGGMNITAERLLIFRAFLRTAGPVSASDVHYAVKCEDALASFAAVYRTLKVMVACGMAREVAGPRRSLLYQHDFQQCAHRHLICKDCGAIIEQSTAPPAGPAMAAAGGDAA